MSKILIERSIINQAIDDFDDIQNALTENGIDVSSFVPTSEYGNKIRSISSGSVQSDVWVRPADRPSIPTISDDEQIIYWLFGVQRNGPNDFAIALTTSVGKYRIEWGDGTQDEYNSTLKAEHLFDYDSIIGQSNQDGYKFIWIKAYPLTGNLTGINVSVLHSLRPVVSGNNIFVPQIFEWYMRAQYVTTFPFSSSVSCQFQLLDIFKYYGTNLITNFAYFLINSMNLKVLDIYTGKGTVFNYFLGSCRTFNQPLNIDTSNGTNFSYFLNNCSAFNSFLNIDTSNGTNFSYFLNNCFSFNKSLNINTKNGTSFGSFLYGCSAFNQSLKIDLLSSTTAIGVLFIGSLCYSLKSLRLKNMGTIHGSLLISNSSLDTDALEELFNDLCDRTGISSGIITLTNVYGVSRLTAEQREIATNKNWTIKE